MQRCLFVVTTLSLCIFARTAGAQESLDHRSQLIEAAAPSEPAVTPKRKRRVLIFNTPAHLMPNDPHKGYCIPYGTHALVTLGKKTRAYDPVVSDDVTVFLPENIKQFDAIMLNNASRDWIKPTDEQLTQDSFKKHGESREEVEQVLRDSLLEFVRQGGGLAALHYAIGANREWPEFHEMLGACLDGHPWNEEVGVKLDEPDHPLVAGFEGKGFRIAEEIYQFRDPYSRDSVRVLLSLDTESTNLTVPHIRRTDGDFALAWVRPFGKGRVFYTAFGHRTEVYWNPAILKHYLAGIQFAAGDLELPTEHDGSHVTTSSSSAENDVEQGFVRIFNGQNLDGWTGDKRIWNVRDGAITGKTTEDTGLKFNDFLIWQAGQPGDFELRLKYKLVGGNSGIYFHALKQSTGEPLLGPQADFSADHRWTGVLMEWKKRDVLAERGQKVLITKDGEKQIVGSLGDAEKLLESVHNEAWNDYAVTVHGHKTILKINDVVMCEVTDNDPKRTPAGHLALQVHKGPPMTVQFKDIRIKLEN